MSIQSEITRISGNVSSALSAIADKGVSVPSGANSDDLATLIGQVETGVDTSDATAAAGDILSGKTAYVNGEKITGTIATKTSSNLTASGATVSVPAGYYASAASKSVSTATQATPSISVSTAGLITASATQSAGYVSAGTESATEQMTIQAAKTVTPGTSAKTAVAAGVYTTGAVKVKGDANLVAENIASGVSIFGVAGTLQPSPFAKMELITITQTSRANSLTIAHSLGQEPDGIIVWITGKPSSSSYPSTSYPGFRDGFVSKSSNTLAGTTIDKYKGSAKYYTSTTSTGTESAYADMGAESVLFDTGTSSSAAGNFTAMYFFQGATYAALVWAE